MGCVTEEFRLVFASLGAVGIIGYLVYFALSEVASDAEGDHLG